MCDIGASFYIKCVACFIQAPSFSSVNDTLWRDDVILCELPVKIEVPPHVADVFCVKCSGSTRVYLHVRYAI